MTNSFLNLCNKQCEFWLPLKKTFTFCPQTICFHICTAPLPLCHRFLFPRPCQVAGPVIMLYLPRQCTVAFYSSFFTASAAVDRFASGRRQEILRQFHPDGWWWFIFHDWPAGREKEQNRKRRVGEHIRGISLSLTISGDGLHYTEIKLAENTSVAVFHKSSRFWHAI